MDEWVRFPFKLAWGEGNPNQEREFYVYENKFYKLWGKNYTIKDLYISNGKYIGWRYSSDKKGIAAIDIGFMCDDIAPGFVDLIWDQDGNCRGYIMLKGDPIEFIPDEFYKKICNISLMKGFLHTDLTPKNIAIFDGVPGLIDFDTPLTKISALDISFETSNGVLRNHIDPRYRAFALKCFREVNENDNSPSIELMN